MIKFMTRLTAVAAVLALSACAAGTDFVHQSNDSLHLGQTTYQQLTASMGKPTMTGSVNKNGATIQTITYAYAKVGGNAQDKGITPARSQAFYFSNNVLVGYEYTSSWKEDSTDFDGSKAGGIQKGVTTRDQVHTMFGQPGGQYVYPMVSDKDGTAEAYINTQTRGFSSFIKKLVVSYDAKGVVTDSDYSENGKK